MWHQGQVILNDNDTISGLIQYSFVKNTILLKKRTERRIILPNKFSDVFLTSLIDSSRHHFQVFQVETSHNYLRPYFFEVEDTTGRLKIYKQYYWEQTTVQNGLGQVSFGYGIFFRLFKIDSKGIAHFIKQKKRPILKILKDKKHLIKTKAKEENWHYNNTYEVLKIIKYYNSLYI